MRWQVGITDIAPSRRHLADLLEGSGVELLIEDETARLVGSILERLPSKSDVLEEVERIRNVIAQATPDTSDPLVSFRVESLYETREDGSTKVTQALTCASVEVRAVAPAAVFTAVITQELSEEERARLEAERIESEHQAWLRRTKPRIVAAIHDEEKVLKVQRFLRKELTSTHVGVIEEIIYDDLGGNVSALAGVTKNKWSRLTGSISHEAVLGDDSRHGVSKGDPPANPMSLEECRAFIVEVADLWFKLKASAVEESQL